MGSQTSPSSDLTRKSCHNQLTVSIIISFTVLGAEFLYFGVVAYVKDFGDILALLKIRFRIGI